MNEKKQLELVEDYLLKKDKSYSVDGLTRVEVLNELQMTDEELKKYYKSKKSFLIGEVARLLIKIEKENLKKEEEE